MARKIRVIKEPTFDDKQVFIKQIEGEYKVGNLACVWSEPTVNLRQLYAYRGKRRLGYKIFFYTPFTEKLEDFVWKLKHGKNLIESTNVQNLFWLEGMAPKILDIIKFESSTRVYWAQVTELMEDEEMAPWPVETIKKADELVKRKHLFIKYRDMGPFHCFGNYSVDFAGYQFRSLEEYREYLRNEIVRVAPHGKTTNAYQSVPEIGLKGVRDLDKRLEVLNFDSTNFQDKTVLVYGCNAGAVCREAARRGAKRVVGLDFPEIAKLAYEIAFHLGYNNVDFYGDNFTHYKTDNKVYEKIKKLTGLYQFDIVMFLSCMQMSWPIYIRKICKEVFYFEGHKEETRDKYDKLLQRFFKKVDYLGQTTDNGSRPAFKCYG